LTSDVDFRLELSTIDYRLSTIDYRLSTSSEADPRDELQHSRDVGADQRLRGLLRHGAAQAAWADLLATSGDPPAPRIRPRADVAVLPYSSGTTGMPKGVMLTHYNIASNVRQSIVARGLSDEDVLLNHLPLYHIYGMTVLMAMPFARGLTTILMPRFDPGLVLAHIARYRPTRFYTVPPAILALVRHPAAGQTDCRSLRTITAAAAPLPLPLAEEFAARTGVRVTMGYGLTETSPTTHVHPDDAPRPGTCGTLLSDTEHRIADATPVDLTRVLKLNKPITRVRYELAQVEGTPLADLIEPIIRMAQAPALSGNRVW